MNAYHRPNVNNLSASAFAISRSMADLPTVDDGPSSQSTASSVPPPPFASSSVRDHISSSISVSSSAELAQVSGSKRKADEDKDDKVVHIHNTYHNYY